MTITLRIENKDTNPDRAVKVTFADGEVPFPKMATESFILYAGAAQEVHVFDTRSLIVEEVSLVLPASIPDPKPTV